MGYLQAFDVQDMIDKFNIKTYVETGTGEGMCISHALLFSFSKLYSIEIDPELHKSNIIKFNDPRLNLINGISREYLPTILNKIGSASNILFFLDAHFPGADFSTGNDRYKDSLNQYGNDAIPLENELNIIAKTRPNNRDVILIDDLRIYTDGGFETGNWSDRKSLGIDGIDFVHTLFSYDEIGS